MAAKNGSAETARLLLAHGAFIEAKANVYHLVTFILVYFLRVMMGNNFLCSDFTPQYVTEWNDPIALGCLVFSPC